MRTPPCFTVGVVLARFTRHVNTNTTPVIPSCLIGPVVLFHMVWEPIMWILLLNSSLCAMCLLLRSGRPVTLPYRPEWWIAAEMVVLLEVSPLSTEELWWRGHHVVGHLPDQGPSAPVGHFSCPASSSDKPNFFHVRIMEATKEMNTSITPQDV